MKSGSRMIMEKSTRHFKGQRDRRESRTIRSTIEEKWEVKTDVTHSAWPWIAEQKQDFSQQSSNVTAKRRTSDLKANQQKKKTRLVICGVNCGRGDEQEGKMTCMGASMLPRGKSSPSFSSPMIMQLKWISGACLSSSIDWGQPSSRPLPLTQCLHQLRSGRWFFSCSIFVARSVVEHWLRLRVVFLSPNYPSPSCFLCSSDSSRTTSSTSSIHARFVSCLIFCFGLTAFTNLFHFTLVAWKQNPCSAGQTSPSSSISCPLVRPAAPQTRLLLFIGILWPALEFSTYVACGPNTTMFPSSTSALTEANGLLTSASKNLMLHFFPSSTNANHPSFHKCRTTACCRQPHRLRRLCPRDTFRIGHTLLPAQSTLISTISCTTSTAFTSSTPSPRSVKLRTSNLLLRLAVVISTVVPQTFACLPLRFLIESAFSNFTNFPQPVALSFTDFTQPVALSSPSISQNSSRTIHHLPSTWTCTPGGWCRLPPHGVCDTRVSPLRPWSPPPSQRSKPFRLFNLLQIHVVLRFFCCLHLLIDVSDSPSTFRWLVSDLAQHYHSYPHSFPCLSSFPLFLGHIPWLRLRLSPHPCRSFCSLLRSVPSSRNCNTLTLFEPRPHLPNLPHLARCHQTSIGSYISFSPPRGCSVFVVVSDTTVAFKFSRRTPASRPSSKFPTELILDKSGIFAPFQFTHHGFPLLLPRSPISHDARLLLSRVHAFTLHPEYWSQVLLSFKSRHAPDDPCTSPTYSPWLVASAKASSFKISSTFLTPSASAASNISANSPLICDTAVLISNDQFATVLLLPTTFRCHRTLSCSTADAETVSPFLRLLLFAPCGSWSIASPIFAVVAATTAVVPAEAAYCCAACWSSPCCRTLSSCVAFVASWRSQRNKLRYHVKRFFSWAMR